MIANSRSKGSKSTSSARSIGEDRELEREGIWGARDRQRSTKKKGKMENSRGGRSLLPSVSIEGGSGGIEIKEESEVSQSERGGGVAI